MNSDPGGWLTFGIDVVGVALLAAALVYGLVQWRRRRTNRSIERVRNDATRRIYEHKD